MAVQLVARGLRAAPRRVAGSLWAPATVVTVCPSAMAARFFSLFALLWPLLPAPAPAGRPQWEGAGLLMLHKRQELCCLLFRWACGWKGRRVPHMRGGRWSWVACAAVWEGRLPTLGWEGRGELGYLHAGGEAREGCLYSKWHLVSNLHLVHPLILQPMPYVASGWPEVGEPFLET